MTWHVVRAPDGTLLLILVGEPIPEGYEVIGETANPDYLSGARPRKMTRLEFRRRFTLAERVAMDAAPNNEALTPELRATARTMLTDLSLAEDIDLDDADIQAGVGLMVSIGILTPERAAAILT